jgi:F-type H+-transporting ATPase subunit O
VPANDKTVKNFLQTLAENNRLSILAGVCEKFGVLMAAAKGEVEMVVTSADKLDNKTLSRLEGAVSKSAYVGQGKKLKVTNKVCFYTADSGKGQRGREMGKMANRRQVNPDIVGGLVVEIGDRTIDLSVSSKVAKMNKLLQEAL